MNVPFSVCDGLDCLCTPELQPLPRLNIAEAAPASCDPSTVEIAQPCRRRLVRRPDLWHSPAECGCRRFWLGLGSACSRNRIATGVVTGLIERTAGFQTHADWKCCSSIAEMLPGRPHKPYRRCIVGCSTSGPTVAMFGVRVRPPLQALRSVLSLSELHPKRHGAFPDLKVLTIAMVPDARCSALKCSQPDLTRHDDAIVQNLSEVKQMDQDRSAHGAHGA